MSSIVELGRGVWADLVEKRLWPVAVALILALIAVPVLIGRSGDATPTPAPSAVPAAAPASPPVGEVVSIPSTPTRRAPGGHYRDPFAGAKIASTPSAASPAPAPAPTSSPAPGSAAGPAGGPSASPGVSAFAAPGRSVAPSPQTLAPRPLGRPPAPAPAVAAGYRVDISLRTPSGRHVVRNDLLRLGTLSVPEKPVAVFLGVGPDRRSTLFLLPANVAASGDGTCHPSPQDCQVVALKRNDLERFTVARSDGSSVHYSMRVTLVARRHASTVASAARVVSRESKAGRAAMRAIIATHRLYVGRYAFSHSRGVLVVRARAAAAPAPDPVAPAPPPAPAAP